MPDLSAYEVTPPEAEAKPEPTPTSEDVSTPEPEQVREIKVEDQEQVQEQEQPTPPKKEKATLSYSHLTTFKNCRMKAYWAYERELESTDQNPNLFQGTVVHEFLDQFYSGKLDDLELQSYLDPFTNKDLMALEGRAVQTAAMIRAYIHYHPKDDEAWKILQVEDTFEAPVRNPASNRPSRSFNAYGRIDLLVQQGDDTYIIDHKTVGTIDGQSISRLWCNQQGLYYALALQEQGIQVSGIIYNLLGKARIRQKQGETDTEFYHRMILTYQEKADELFHREMIPIMPRELELCKAETWELTQQMLTARKEGAWYQNRGCCFLYNSKCPYWELCTSYGDEQVIATLYQPRERVR